MNLNDLSIFINIYETGSLNQSAKALGYAQSNISARLQAIEREMGVQLFSRKYTGVVPTVNGREFYRFATATLTNLKALQANMQPTKKSVLISELLLDWDIHYKKRVDIGNDDIDICRSSDIFTRLREKEFDKIFCYQALTNLTNYRVQSNKIVASYLSLEEPGSQEELPLIVSKDKSCPFRKKSLIDYPSSKQIIELDSFKNIMNVVEQGSGFALLPEWMGQTKNFKRFNDQIIGIPFYFYEKL